MKSVAGCLVCLFAGTVWGQQYTISTFAGGTPAPVEAAAVSLALAPPGRVATDPSGNLYFTALNSVYKVDAMGNAIRVAGNGRAGFGGDKGPALSAELNGPQGIFITSAGDVYIADTGNNRIRLVSGGTITTIAGTGVAGVSGDFSDPLMAQLHLPMAVALDGQGNVYICDTGNNEVRMISQGVLLPFAGDYIQGYSGDGGSPNGSALNSPTDIAFDAAGDMFIADSGNARVREITNGTISSIIGAVTGSTINFVEGGSATGTLLTAVRSIAVDSGGDIVYLTDSDANRVRKVVSSKITTVAGTGPSGFTGDGGMATSAQLNYPASVAVDPAGNVYFVDLSNARVRKVNTSGVISTVAGNGTGHYSGDGGSAQSAQMNGPSGLAFSAGVLEVADTNNQRVRAINSNGIISTLAGTGAPGSGGDSAAASAAQLWYPGGVSVDGSGNVFIADTANQRVRKVTPGGTITTFAGSGTGGYGGDGGPAATANLNSPAAVLAAPNGIVYIADYNNHAIRKVSAAGTITTVAGNGRPGYAGDGNQAALAQLNSPSGLALDPAGNLYVADTGNHVVRVIDAGGNIHTFAGTGQLGDSGDGAQATAAQLISPVGIAIDALGNVLITDGGAGKVRLVNRSGVITTIAGTGKVGYSGDGGAATSAQFNSLAGITIDPAGNIYLADSGNFAIRMLQLTSSTPGSGAVTNSASNSLGAVAPGELITLYGTGLGPEQIMMGVPDDQGVYPAQVGGAAVYINGIPARLVYSWTNQIAAQVPFEATPAPGSLTVHYGGQVALQIPLQVAATAPALFSIDGSGVGQAWAINQDGVMNSSATPAAAGSTITVFANGLGLMSPNLQDGTNGPGQPVEQVTASIGAQPATVQAQGLSGLAPGMVMITIQVPSGVSGPTVPITISAGGSSSQTGLSIAVQ
jgi:uncharacterized protein (TIGR03437 family)